MSESNPLQNAFCRIAENMADIRELKQENSSLRAACRESGRAVARKDHVISASLDVIAAQQTVIETLYLCYLGIKDNISEDDHDLIMAILEIDHKEDYEPQKCAPCYGDENAMDTPF